MHIVEMKLRLYFERAAACSRGIGVGASSFMLPSGTYMRMCCSRGCGTNSCLVRAASRANAGGMLSAMMVRPSLASCAAFSLRLIAITIPVDAIYGRGLASAALRAP